MSYLILSVFLHPHKKRNQQQLCYASSVAFFIYRKTLLFILTISSKLIWDVLSKHFLRYFLDFSWSRKLTKNGNTLDGNMYTMHLSMWLKKSWRGIKGIKYLCMALYSEMSWLYVVVCRLVSFFSASKKAETSSSTNCICRYFLSLAAVIFHPPFPNFFFLPGRDILWTTSPCLLVIRFIKSTFTAMFTITGIMSIVITFIVSFKKARWWQKGIYLCPLKAISDASLCFLCKAFLKNLYCARVWHGMAQFALKIAHLSILMGPTLLRDLWVPPFLLFHFDWWVTWE